MAKKIRCEWYDLWAEQIGFKSYRRKTRCKATATVTLSDNPRLYAAPLYDHNYCVEHAGRHEGNAGMILKERIA